jgi:hypothetical protein
VSRGCRLEIGSRVRYAVALVDKGLWLTGRARRRCCCPSLSRRLKAAALNCPSADVWEPDRHRTHMRPTPTRPTTNHDRRTICQTRPRLRLQSLYSLFHPVWNVQKAPITRTRTYVLIWIYSLLEIVFKEQRARATTAKQWPN